MDYSSIVQCICIDIVPARLAAAVAAVAAGGRGVARLLAAMVRERG